MSLKNKINPLKFAFSAGVFIILSLFVAMALSYFIVEYKQLPRIDENLKSFEVYKKDILADLQLIERHKPFNSVPRTIDAGHYLNQYIPWVDSLARMTPPRYQFYLDLQKLWGRHPNRYGEKEFAVFSQDPLIQRIETDWLDELFKYDHWDFWNSAKFAKFVQDLEGLRSIERLSTMATHPVQDYNTLMQFGVVYFIKNEKVDRLRAYQLLRKIAQLIWSTHTLHGEAASVAVLNVERTLQSFYPEPRHKVVSSDVTEAYKRLAFSWPHINSYINFKMKLPKELKKFMTPEYGFCGDGSSLYGLGTVADFFQPSFFPFERDFSDQIQYYREFRLWASSVCNTQSLDGLAEATPQKNNLLCSGCLMLIFPNLNYQGIWFNPEVIPYLRRYVGLKLSHLDSEPWLPKYRDQK